MTSAARCLAILAALLLAPGCMKVTVLEYQPVTVPLDDKSELHISTYPSWFPRITSEVPFLYKELVTPDSVYFQVYVRPVGQNAGKNPHVESIRIHRFAYRFPGQEPVVLMTDHDDYFWMQGDTDDNPVVPDAVPHGEGWYLQLEVDLTLNGQRFVIDETAYAGSRSDLRPLLLQVLE